MHFDTPLPLPPDYNPATHMCAQSTEFGTFHETRRAAHLATRLVENGTGQDLEVAEAVLQAVLACQEVDPRDPHHGNFYWMREDDHVEDLNAVEFVLEALIPMMIRHGSRLPSDLQVSVLDAIRLGLTEIARLDVLVAYTNITALDILNTCLGGELLHDGATAQRGYRKLLDWIAYTSLNGHPLEYNSPTYTAVTLRALKQLSDLGQDADTGRRARALAARLGLSVALHIHAGTGRWAGPHGRAYQPSVVCETPPEVDRVTEWLADGTLPAWIEPFLTARPDTYQIDETAEQRLGISLTAYITPAYALGTASSSFNPQANVCIAHYARPGADRPGVFYTRYIRDDKWFGDAYHATDRTKTRNLPDEGDFFAVQQGNRALCVYSSGAMNQCHSAKAVAIWTRRAEIEEIWAGDRRVQTLPHALEPGEGVEIVSGGARVFVQPLTRTALGKEAPALLVERDGDLVLEMFNYRGPPKRFWELNWPGAFYKGRPFCAFYVEIAPRGAEGHGPLLSRRVHQGTFAEDLQQPYTFAASGERLYRAEYGRGGQKLGLEIDLMAWQLRRRWTEEGDLGWPQLRAPTAAQAEDGEVVLGDARLSCRPGPAWLATLSEGQGWVAGYLGSEAADLSLTTPQGTVQVAQMETGVVIWRNDQVTVDARHGSVSQMRPQREGY